jgi:hypothetical protein
MPIIKGVDIFDQVGKNLISKKSYIFDSAPISIFNTKSELNWVLNGQQMLLGSLILYSSSEVVLDRVLFGFSLIAITTMIKLCVLFWLFI